MMAIKFPNRVREEAVFNSNTIELTDSAIDGYQTFNSVINNGKLKLNDTVGVLVQDKASSNKWGVYIAVVGHNVIQLIKTEDLGSESLVDGDQVTITVVVTDSLFSTSNIHYPDKVGPEWWNVDDTQSAFIDWNDSEQCWDIEDNPGDSSSVVIRFMPKGDWFVGPPLSASIDVWMPYDIEMSDFYDVQYSKFGLNEDIYGTPIVDTSLGSSHQPETWMTLELTGNDIDSTNITSLDVLLFSISVNNFNTKIKNIQVKQNPVYVVGDGPQWWRLHPGYKMVTWDPVEECYAHEYDPALNRREIVLTPTGWNRGFVPDAISFDVFLSSTGTQGRDIGYDRPMVNMGYHQELYGDSIGWSPPLDEFFTVWMTKDQIVSSGITEIKNIAFVVYDVITGTKLKNIKLWKIIDTDEAWWTIQSGNESSYDSENNWWVDNDSADNIALEISTNNDEAEAWLHSGLVRRITAEVMIPSGLSSEDYAGVRLAAEGFMEGNVFTSTVEGEPLGENAETGTWTEISVDGLLGGIIHNLHCITGDGSSIPMFFTQLRNIKIWT